MNKEARNITILSSIGAIFVILLIVWGIGSIKADRAEVANIQWEADAPQREAEEKKQWEADALKKEAEVKRQKYITSSKEKQKELEKRRTSKNRYIFGIELGGNISSIKSYVEETEYESVQAKNDQLEKVWIYKKRIRGVEDCIISSYQNVIYLIAFKMSDGSLKNFEAITQTIEDKYNTSDDSIFKSLDSDHHYNAQIHGLGAISILIDHDSVIESIINDKAEISLTYILDGVLSQLNKAKLNLKKSRINRNDF